MDIHLLHTYSCAHVQMFIHRNAYTMCRHTSIDSVYLSTYKYIYECSYLYMWQRSSLLDKKWGVYILEENHQQSDGRKTSKGLLSFQYTAKL